MQNIFAPHPPPPASLLWLIVFSSMMIMISLAVEQMQIHKHLPWQTSWRGSVIIFFRQKERHIFKRKYIKPQTLPILFLSSPSLCHALIHLFLWSIMHVDPSTPAAPLGTAVSHTYRVFPKHLLPLVLTRAKQALSVCVFKNCIPTKNLLTISRSCMPGLSQDRCRSAGSAEHQHHTGVLIRHTNNSVRGAVTDVWNSHSD